MTGLNTLLMQLVSAAARLDEQNVWSTVGKRPASDWK